jgi:spore germination protein KB
VENGKKNYFLLGAVIGGGILIVTSFLTITVLGAETTANEYFASFRMAQYINVTNFLRRVEGLFSAIWIVTIYFKLAISFYVSVLCLDQVLGLNRYRILILPLAIILVTLSLKLFSNINEFMIIFTGIWPSFTLGFGLLLPLLLFLV